MLSPVFIDSHSHVDFPYIQDRMPEILAQMKTNGVELALCPGVNLESFDRLYQVISAYPQFYGAVAVHPGYDDVKEPTIEDLVDRAQRDKIVAIGETGLDYHYFQGDLTWQKDRFRNHIRAAIIARKPLIIHCREAAQDVITILKEENAQQVGGVMHCFSENAQVAQSALDMDFYISFSGVVTFKNAQSMRAVAKTIPLDRLLIETDAPYVAPVPHRGKLNEPGFVLHVAQSLAQSLDIPLETLAEKTTQNFYRLFKIDPTPHP